MKVSRRGGTTSVGNQGIQMTLRRGWNPLYVYIYTYTHISYTYTYTPPDRGYTYGVATISRLLQIIGLFCKRAL